MVEMRINDQGILHALALAMPKADQKQTSVLSGDRLTLLADVRGLRFLAASDSGTMFSEFSIDANRIADFPSDGAAFTFGPRLFTTLVGAISDKVTDKKPAELAIELDDSMHLVLEVEDGETAHRELPPLGQFDQVVHPGFPSFAEGAEAVALRQDAVWASKQFLEGIKANDTVRIVLEPGNGQGNGRILVQASLDSGSADVTYKAVVTSGSSTRIFRLNYDSVAAFGAPSGGFEIKRLVIHVIDGGWVRFTYEMDGAQMRFWCAPIAAD